MVLEVSKLSVFYDNIQIIREISFFLSEGVVAVVGPNGAGKTTLLKAISGLINYEGSVKILSKELSTFSAEERARLVTYVPPLVDAMPDISVGDLILSDPLVNNEVLEKYVELFELGALLKRRLSRVSSGELSRALLVKGLSRNSRILTLDEPLSHIDMRFQLILLKHLRVLSREDKIILVASNQLNPLLSYVDKIIALKKGEAIFIGNITDFIKSNIAEKIYEVKFEIIMRDKYLDLIPKELP
ncbi:MAG: ABC transporter ATP-binding protein [Desulfurococcaceae archaeon TW002]